MYLEVLGAVDMGNSVPVVYTESEPNTMKNDRVREDFGSVPS